MVDPSDYLHAELVIGSGRCEIVDSRGRVVLGCRRRNDNQAIKGLRSFIEALQNERANQGESCK